MSKRKFVFYYPNSSYWFRPTLRDYLYGKRLPCKYSSFFNFILNSELEVWLAPSMIRGDIKSGGLKFTLELLKLIAWCFINRVSLRKVKIAFTIESIKNADYLFLMQFGIIDNDDRGKQIAELFSDSRATKIIHLTHYAFHPTIGATNLKILNPDILVAENNLSKNSKFFKKEFGFSGCHFIHLPYVFSPRFSKKINFSNRINKIVVSGTISGKIIDKKFLDFYGDGTLSPMRRALLDASKNHNSEMDCFISDYEKEVLRLNSLKKEEKFPLSLIQKFSTLESCRAILGLLGYDSSNYPQTSYYKKNIVDLYNGYMMFAVPEEVCDLPAIGFVEGMACGCAYFGKDDPMYLDIGLIPNVHYISYDGTVENLMENVQYYQEHTEELEIIAKRGYEYVCKNLRADIVYKRFLSEIESYAIKDKLTEA